MASVIDATIDNEQITGAFALAVDAVFYNLADGTGQNLFEFSDEGRTSVLTFSQIGQTADVEFTLVQNEVAYSVVAENAIVEGEYATWRVGIDPDGVMRISKNQDLLAEGPGVVPTDVERDYLIGASLAQDDTDLDGAVVNLKIANYGDVEQLDPAYQASPCATTGETRCFCDKLLPDGLAKPGVEGETVIATTDAEGDGEWSAVQSMGVIAIHSVVLPDGKLFYYGTDEDGTQTGQFVYGLYDPQTGVDITLPNTTDTDIFCTTLSLDPSTGNILLFGGDARGEGGPKNGAVNDVVVFDYTTRTIRDINDPEMQLIYPNGDEMKYDRWYGSSVTMANGEILVLGGKGAPKGGLLGLFGQTKATEDKVEVFNPQTGWRELTGVDIDVDYWYPKLYAASDGTVVTFAYDGVYRIDAAGTGASEKIGKVDFPNKNDSPSVMYGIDKIAIIGDDGYIYTADISQDTIVFERQVEVVSSRGDGSLVVLPDGKVMLVGGTDGGQNDLDKAEYRIEIWDPVTNAVETIDAGQELARLYHSSYQLLPNGLVFVGGGGAPGPLVNTNAEFYAPSYLYDENGNEADRPQIVDVASNIDNDETFQITVDDVSDIAQVTVLRTGGFTHAVNFDTRFTELEFTVINDTTIEVTSLSAQEMIPGAWMLFVIDNNGVPSEANMLGVAMADLVETPDLTVVDGELGVYGIDDDQIDGAFEIQVEARFDDLSQKWQRVFDFGNGASSDNIVLTQDGRSDDMRFAIYVEGKRYHITAKDAIVEGELAKWTANVDETGYMRLYKDDVLVAEGQGAVPRDVERTSNLVGESNWDGDDALNGLVRNLEIVNDGDLPEYIHLGTPKIGLRSLGNVIEADNGETTTLVFEAFLDQPAPAVIAADILLNSGNVTGPAKLVIGAGQTSGLIEVTANGNDVFNLDNTVTITLTNVTQARVEGDLTASAKIIDNDDVAPRNLLETAGLVGDAEIQDGAVRLTAERKGQEGALATTSRIDFTQDFAITASVYLGDNDRGADGMGFVFHNDPDGVRAIGRDGASLGIYGIHNGFGFELDTHKGDDDIKDDHFAFFDANSKNRLSDHVALDNLEDGDMHDVEILWSAADLKLTILLDGQDLGSIGGPDTYASLGDDYGYLTIAAATGGRTNEHRVDSLTFRGQLESDQPTISIAAPEDQFELGPGEVGEMLFVAKLSEATDTDVTALVTVTGANGPNSVTIPAGATSADIRVSFLGDDVFDGDTMVTVELTDAVNANLDENPLALATILEDDLPPPVMSLIAPDDTTEGAAGETGTIVFVAKLDRPAQQDITATVDVDGATGPSSVTIAAGESVATIPVTFAGNDVADGDRDVTVVLSDLDGATAGLIGATSSLLDDDVAEPRDLIDDMVLNGHAEFIGDGIRLTPDSRSKTGVAATESRIDFTEDFEIEASVYLGDSNRGADGLGFAFHNDARGAAAIGGGGSKSGVIGIRDGFGFELDTHRGRGDIRDDHFNFLNTENGQRLSSQYDLNNIEDNRNHNLLIQWDASEASMQVYFDGTLVGAAEAADTLALMGDTAGYLSIGAATGGRTNEHRIDSFVFTGVLEDEFML